MKWNPSSPDSIKIVTLILFILFKTLVFKKSPREYSDGKNKNLVNTRLTWQWGGRFSYSLGSVCGWHRHLSVSSSRSCCVVNSEPTIPLVLVQWAGQCVNYRRGVQTLPQGVQTETQLWHTVELKLTNIDGIRWTTQWLNGQRCYLAWTQLNCLFL